MTVKSRLFALLTTRKRSRRTVREQTSLSTDCVHNLQVRGTPIEEGGGAGCPESSCRDEGRIARVSLELAIRWLQTPWDKYRHPADVAYLSTFHRRLSDQMAHTPSCRRTDRWGPSQIYDESACLIWQQGTSEELLFFNEAKEYIHELNAKKFALLIGLSVPQLNRKIKALTGQTTGDFIRTYRLNRASVLIKNKSATIAEIAYDVGFSSPSYFAECFRLQFGLLPSEFHDKS